MKLPITPKFFSSNVPSWFCWVYLEFPPFLLFLHLKHPFFLFLVKSQLHFKISQKKKTKREEKKENQHFYQASWVQGHMAFCLSGYCRTVHPLMLIFFYDPPFFFKSHTGAVCVFTYPTPQYQTQEQVHSTCSVNICWICESYWCSQSVFVSDTKNS